ncbi:hypothetical protein C5167_035436 [Papaver somniferum]|uniref:Uncharacterized protein n=1 Tax=Papaver somniferum TaxID=3469 RepID=A0A4Y7KJZ9_PAPSO|nr:hypothetical protein C5167_035436 [Papaver somniferum]
MLNLDAFRLARPVLHLLWTDAISFCGPLLTLQDNHATSAAETDQDFMSWTRKEIEGEQVIRSTTDADKDV